MPKTRNSELLESFVTYCQENPELRFWQALANWSGIGFILAASYLTNRQKMIDSPVPYDLDSLQDTYYWEYKNS